MAIVTRAGKGSQLTHAELDNNFTELEQIPEGKVFPKTVNKGIKVDTAAPDFGWHDLVGNLYTAGLGGSAASYAIYRGGIQALQFDEGDEAKIDLHMPHDYAMGTPIYIHVHWSHASTVVTGGSCTWAFEVMYAKGHDQGVFEAPITASVVANASTTQYRHLVSETVLSDNGGSATTLDTNMLEPDGIIQIRAYLDSNDMTTSDLSVVAPFIHFVDIHYQSNGIPTKNKAPGFWG